MPEAKTLKSNQLNRHFNLQVSESEQLADRKRTRRVNGSQDSEVRSQNSEVRISEVRIRNWNPLVSTPDSVFRLLTPDS